MEKYRVENGYQYHVRAIIEGKEAILILDTGATGTILDEEYVKTYFPHVPINYTEETALDVNGSVPFGKIVVEDFKVESLHLSNVQLSVLPLGHINDALEDWGHPRIHGILGTDILHECGAIISLKKQQLTFNV